MPKISEQRKANVIRLATLLRVLNGEYSWGELKRYFLVRYATALQLRHPEAIEKGKPIGYPRDQDFRNAAELLRTTLEGWATAWIEHPPSQKDHDEDVYMKENGDLLKEFQKMVDDLPHETALNLFVPGRASQVSATEPPDPSRWVRRDIENLLPRGAGSGQFVSLKEYVNDIWASVRFNTPIEMAKGIAVSLFRVLLRSAIPLGRCRLSSCNLYFLNLSGVTQFCSRRHAQAVVNKKRDRGREAAIARVAKAIKEYESEAKPHRDWKEFVVRHAHVSRYWVTLLLNRKVISAPARLSANGGPMRPKMAK